MSLFLTIRQIINVRLDGQMKIEPKISLIVQNSKSGAILVQKMKFNRIKWDEGYKFVTNFDENVQFILIKGDEKSAQLKQNILGKGTLYTKKFMKMFQSKIQEKQSKNEFFEYQITLYKPQNKEQQTVAGVIELQIEMDVNNRYEGQVISSSDLDLRGQMISNPKFVKFYLGKSSKINFFSLFDERADTTKFRFLESIYKDLE